MADSKPENGCTRCAEMAAQVAALQAQVNALEAKLAKSQKHSGNSSKPPSSDIVKPPRKSGKKGRRPKRKIGGQPGHDRHERTPFSPHELDEHWLWHYSECPCCGGGLRDTEETGRTIQQIELMEFPVQVTQHTAQGQWCPTCQKSFVPTLPEELRKAGLVGARLTALVGFLKGACHMSYSTIRKYFRDVQGVTISRGMLRKLVGKVSASLADPYEALCAMLPSEERLNVDETGHQVYGQLLLADLRRLFSVIHRRDTYASPENFQRALEAARAQLVWDATRRTPLSREASNLAQRFRDNAESYFRFITEPNVEPTNNLAEQAIRFVAIHRRITQGTRSEDGRRWCERIWTVIQTCSQQSRSVFEFLCSAVTAYFRSDEAPSLLPDTS